MLIRPIILILEKVVKQEIFAVLVPGLRQLLDFLKAAFLVGVFGVQLVGEGHFDIAHELADGVAVHAGDAVDGALEQLHEVGFYGGLAAVVDVTVSFVDVAEVLEEFV
jgi:hypothetical protein